MASGPTTSGRGCGGAFCYSVLDSRRIELELVSIQFWDDMLGIAVHQLPRRTHIGVSDHNPNCSSSVSEKDNPSQKRAHKK